MVRKPVRKDYGPMNISADAGVLFGIVAGFIVLYCYMIISNMVEFHDCLHILDNCELSVNDKRISRTELFSERISWPYSRNNLFLVPILHGSISYFLRFSTFTFTAAWDFSSPLRSNLTHLLEVKKPILVLRTLHIYI